MLKKIKNAWQAWHRFWGRAFLGKSFDSVYKFHEQLLSESELLGIEQKDAPINKLLVAIIKQAKNDGMSAISFEVLELESTFRIIFWLNCNSFELSGDSIEAMTAPKNLMSPLLCHALWMINHRDSTFDSARGTFFFLYPSLEVARWAEDMPKCRCWLRDPGDMASLTIQLI